MQKKIGLRGCHTQTKLFLDVCVLRFVIDRMDVVRMIGVIGVAGSFFFCCNAQKSAINVSIHLYLDGRNVLIGIIIRPQQQYE